MSQAARRIIRYRSRLTGSTGFAGQRDCASEAVSLLGSLFTPEELEVELRNGESVTIDLSTVDILAPVDPPAVIGTGLNYKRHAEECGLPVPPVPFLAFFKGQGSVIGAEAPIRIPTVVTEPEVDWEVELAVVIGKTARDVPVGKALDYVLGYTVANDLSARKWQTDPDLCAGQFNRGKGFDTFCPLGPAIVLQERGFDPHNLAVKTVVNGEVMQDSSTSDLIYSVQEIVAFLSQDTTLYPGTVILTGTPEGIGMSRDPPQYLVPGDVVEVSIEGIGALRNPVVGSDAPRE